MSHVSATEKIPLATKLLRREALIFIVALVCSLLIFLFSLRLVFLTMWDQATQAVRVEIEKEADTIARLLVFEFSHLKELEMQTDQSSVDDRVKRLLWEKVTFNEAIRGIELIRGQPNAQGQNLTYSYFPSSHMKTEAEQGPQKAFKSFSGPEGELIGIINKEQRVDNNLLESINRGTKLEGEMLLRYFPLYIPLPDQGAVYWGVTKVGINIDAMRRFLVLLEDEKTDLRRTLAWIMGGVTTAVLFLGLLGFRWVSRKTAEPLGDYGKMTSALESGSGVDIESLLAHLNKQETQDILEFEQLQTFCLRLGGTIKLLGERLIDSERQACLGRLAVRIMSARAGQDVPGPGPADWGSLFKPFSEEWREVYLQPYFNQISGLVTAVLPPESSLLEDRQPIESIYGCEANLVQAVLLLMDFALMEMQPGGQLHWRVSPLETGGFDLELSFPGRNFRQEDITLLLQPFQAVRETLPPLGLFLVSAMARQHLGSLLVQPNPGGGLSLRLEIPDSKALTSGGAKIEHSGA